MRSIRRLWSAALPVPCLAGVLCAQLATVPVADVDAPLFLTTAPGDPDRLFVAGQFGEIRIVEDGAVLPQPFLEISALLDTTGTQQGMLGMAFHPDYQANGAFYVNYTGLPDGEAVLARYQVSANPDVADPDSAEVVLRLAQQTVTHNLAWMGFGPDGYLYVASGDGGGGYDIGDDAQNLDSLLGKILRLDVDCDQFPEDPDRNYGIPPDNPFVGVAGADEVWAYGLRHPWRCSFDRATGDLYIGDVGQVSREELDFQPAASGGGENYGWDCREATVCTGECACESPEFTDPIWSYVNPDEGRAIIGGYVYRGTAIPWLAGDYLVGEYQAGRFWRLRHDGTALTFLEEITDQLDPPDTPGLLRGSSFGQDAAGELYVCALTFNRIYKIVASCPPDLDGDGTVGIGDFLLVLGAWGTPGGDADGDGDTGIGDFLAVVGAWGPCP